MLKTKFKILYISFRLYITGREIEHIRSRINKEIPYVDISLYASSVNVIRFQRKVNSFRALEKEFNSLLHALENRY